MPMPICMLPGKVSSANALVVTLDGGAAGMTLATITTAGIGTTSTDALVLQNTTAAAAGAQQMSGRIRFDGFGWKTDATAGSQAVSVIAELLPVQGAAAPTANLLWKYAVNGGAYSTLMTLKSSGQLEVEGSIISAQSFQATNGSLTVGSGGFMAFGARGIVKSPGDGQVNVLNNGETTGVGLDFNTDAVLKIRTRAQSGYATIDALAYRVSGAAGVSFGPGVVTSITVVNGIVTAIS